eukprot:TCALIF_08831-PA protein Name:"Protein of unknown function" AED:0.09 eAED:0.09 QI:1296/0.33/0.5/0.5/1/0.5/4/0/92
MNGLVLELSLVLDISHITAIPINSVGDLLCAAVGEEHVVSTIGVVSLTSLIGIKVQTGIFILDLIVVLNDLVEKNWFVGELELKILPFTSPF